MYVENVEDAEDFSVDLLMPTLECKRCGHIWIPKRPFYPKVCPQCKSPYWNKNYRRADFEKKHILKMERKAASVGSNKNKK